MKLRFLKILDYRFILPILVFVQLISCENNEEFVSTIVDGDVPNSSFVSSSGSLEVNFTNTSENFESSYWLFGDGSNSTEESPTHTYAIAGKYNVTLKTNSPAGYSSTTTKELNVAGPASATYTVTPVFRYTMRFDASGSQNISSVKWDFGDGSPGSTERTLDHDFPSEGKYTVTLTVRGLLGDQEVFTQEVEVIDQEVDLISGGNMEMESSGKWSNWSNQNNNPPVFGYTQDSPTTGEGSCLKFNSFTAPADGSINQLIYQEVEVVKGAKYKLSAQVKIPAGAYQSYIQFYISEDPNSWIEDASNPDANHFLCLNTWHGWNSTAIDGDLLEAVKANGAYGIGVGTDGVYTAKSDQKVYIGIQVGSWSGYSNGDVLIDQVKFIRIE